MRRLAAIVLVSSAVVMGPGCRAATPALASLTPPTPAAPPPDEDATPPPLRPVTDFASIVEPKVRSVALFAEAGRVLTHPRCTNCHPPDGVPRQGLEQHPHVPQVVGGPEGHGAPGLPCVTCHQQANIPTVGAAIRSIPGNPKWALAPGEMAWVGQSLGHICEQIKDPHRNGGRTLEALHHHMAEDALVGWAWNPGPGRQPVPGTQRAFGDLIQAWIDTGAECPKP